MNRQKTFKFTALLLGMLLTGQAQAAGIAYVTIPITATVAKMDEVHGLIIQKMQSLAGAANNTGVKTIHLQAVFYTLTPVAGGGYNVSGNLSIDAVPENKTRDFVASLVKNGQQATIEYFRNCGGDR